MLPARGPNKTGSANDLLRRIECLLGHVHELLQEADYLFQVVFLNGVGSSGAGYKRARAMYYVAAQFHVAVELHPGRLGLEVVPLPALFQIDARIVAK